jgi:predicted acyl esterase
LSRGAVAALAATIAVACGSQPAGAAEVTQQQRFAASDGVTLQVTVTGEGPLAARPAIVEFSPYGRNSGTFDAGAAYNHVLVQIRGTGDSDGSFDALGPRTQKDVAELLRWACDQPWSDGRLGLNGFSASAITIYNSLHQHLPCVRAMVLKSGTFELYRDLIWPGGISNLVPSAGVMALIGAPAAAQIEERLRRAPASGPAILTGLLDVGLNGLLRPTLDSWWRERGFRGNANDVPALIVNGFYDVESRGAFQGYQELRGDGAHMIVLGAHDAAPAGTDAGRGEMKAWFDRYLLGVPNGIEDQPRVKLWLTDGDREDYVGGRFVRVDGDDWPLPGTRWTPLHLDPARSGTATSVNDGSLRLAAPATSATQLYPQLPSWTFSTDLPNAGIAGSAGADAITAALPVLSDMTVAEPLGLSYTTAPLAQDVLMAGPGSLEVLLSSTAPATGIWAVISDVSPDGTAHPVAAGRLNTTFPGVDGARSLTDPVSGDIVQPYGRYDQPNQPQPGELRPYRVELWPIGNRFVRGHRLRLHIVGQSLASLPAAPAVNGVRLGPAGSRLLLPVLPGSDLPAALGS